MSGVYNGGYAGCTVEGMLGVQRWVYLGVYHGGYPRVYHGGYVPRGVPRVHHGGYVPPTMPRVHHGGYTPSYYASTLPHPGYTYHPPSPLLSVHHLLLTLRCQLLTSWAQNERNPWVRGGEQP